MGTKRVLVVEDDERIARGYVRLLGARGFEVVVAGTVADAIAELEAAATGVPFDHMTLDIRLPDGDGENVLLFAETLPQPPAVVVVAAPVGLDARRFAALQGRCMYLPKPIVIDTLIDAFERSPVALVRQYCILHDFSEQETATFEAALAGLDEEDVAIHIGCKASTVRTYFGRIGEKTGTEGRHHVIAHFARWLLSRVAGTPRPSRVEPVAPAPRNVVPITRPG